MFIPQLICPMYLVLYYHSGLVESSGPSEWELLSMVNNKQRGSQERMIEKLRYTVEHKQQSRTESELKSTTLRLVLFEGVNFSDFTN